MTTTLVANMQELSKQIGDSWQSTTTGAGTSATLVDTALKAKANDWIQNDPYAFLTEEPGGSAAIYDERKISSLDNSSGTLTTIAFSAAPGSGIDYEVHRLFTPSDKRIALLYADHAGFPAIHEKVRDESFVAGNWLKDGSFETWDNSSTLTNWTESGLTLTQTSTATLFKHGTYSAKVDGSTGYFEQTVSEWDDLKYLAGKNVTLTCQVHCDTADDLRIAVVYDGTNIEYSDYHDGDSTWTADNDPLSVQIAIDDNPTAIKFRIYHDTAAGVSYVDDFRLIGPDGARLYIGGLGLAQNTPHGVYVEQSDYNQRDPWLRLDMTPFNFEDGYMTTPGLKDRRLRIEGMGYLDFLASGSSSTAWTATINIESPQTDILVAQAALYLYTRMSMPNFDSGSTEAFQRMIGFWQQELDKRIRKFRMPSLPITIQSPV